MVNSSLRTEAFLESYEIKKFEKQRAFMVYKKG